MNCKHVMRRLSAYLDGELPGDEMLLIRRHLAECESCSNEHYSLRKTKLMLANLKSAVPVDGMIASISQKLDNIRPVGVRTESTEMFPTLRRWYLKAGLATAICALAAMAMYINSAEPARKAPAPVPVATQNHIITEMPLSVFSSSSELPCIPPCVRNGSMMLREQQQQQGLSINWGSEIHSR